MALTDPVEWMDEHANLGVVWYVKRLSGNDTLANRSHQAGPYVPKEFLFRVFPTLHRPDVKNPDKWFDLRIDSHCDVRTARAVWYNNKLLGGTRNEARLTNLGGANSALLDPDSTGSLAVFAFHKGIAGADSDVCHVWVCDHEAQAELIEERIGPVEPGRFVIWSVDDAEANAFVTASQFSTSCCMKPSDLPEDWAVRFPSGAEIVRKTVEMRSGHGLSADDRLIKRRDCEYAIFRSIEDAVELPCVKGGFESMDDFIAKAQAVLQRRKARSGRSLELHVRAILIEEGLVEGVDFEYQPESEGGKCPDFLFPNQSVYKDPDFPERRLRMLAAKTTCKDRWRQVLNEADRCLVKHILTLQEGISENQFKEMCDANVKLVVPHSLVGCYPSAVRPHLVSLESFIGDVRLLGLPG